jgi:hypothetical protein
MKKIALVLLLSALVSQCTKMHGGEEGAPAVTSVFSYITGDVKLIRAGQREDAVVGMRLNADDTIVTGENGRADLLIKDYGILKVGPGAELSLAKLSEKKATINLMSGDMVSLINRASSSSEFSVVTPTAIAGVRGTAFLAGVSRGKDKNLVRFAVLSGAVAVSSGGEEIFLEKDLQIVIEGKKKATRDMIRPLSTDSLKSIQTLAVVHKSSVLGFDSMVNDIRRSSPELRVLEGRGSVQEELSARESKNSRTSETVKKADKADMTKHLNRDTEGDPLKLQPSSGY